jgi:hypothetical protein
VKVCGKVHAMTTQPRVKENSKPGRKAERRLQRRKSHYDELKGSSDASRREPGSLKQRTN